jgi:hypothetical protein
MDQAPSAPPPDQMETPPPPPPPGVTWLWKPGHWVYRPFGYVFVPGHWL